MYVLLSEVLDTPVRILPDILSQYQLHTCISLKSYHGNSILVYFEEYLTVNLMHVVMIIADNFCLIVDRIINIQQFMMDGDHTNDVVLCCLVLTLCCQVLIAGFISINSFTAICWLMDNTMCGLTINHISLMLHSLS